MNELQGGALTEIELNNKSVRQLRKIVKDNRIPKDTPITNMSKSQIITTIKASEWWRRNKLNPVEPEAQDIQPAEPIIQPAEEDEIIRTNTIQIDEDEGIKPASIVNINGKYIIKLFTQKKKAEPPADQLQEINEQLNEIAENPNIPAEVQQEIIEVVENQIKDIVQEQEAEEEQEADNPEEVVSIKTKTSKARKLLKELSKLILEIENL